MGETLAQRVISTMPPTQIDVVIPIPESSRPSAMQLAQKIGKPYREGFVKNRYVGRTFIMPGQAVRKSSVRQKLNAIAQEFKGRNVLLVDDSIVRGKTSKEIVQMAREAGRAQGVPCVGRAAGALSERLRHRHADQGRADRARPQRRGDPRVHRRRRADLPGHRCDEARRQGAQPEARRLRGVVLRRQLHHRRCQRRPTSRRWKRSADCSSTTSDATKTPTSASRLALQERDGGVMSRPRRQGHPARRAACRRTARHAGGARRPAGQSHGAKTPRRCSSPAASCTRMPPRRRHASPTRKRRSSTAASRTRR